MDMVLYTMSTIVMMMMMILVLLHVWKFLKWAWFEPRQKEKQLRQQGFNGNSYRFLLGDFKDISRKAKEVQSKPMAAFSNDILETTLAFFYEALQENGENCFVWLGTKPTVLITDPEMIKEIFSRNYIFQKINSPLNKLIARGVAEYDTEKWAKHRRLLNPAFHLEKVKHMLPSFYSSCVKMLSNWEEIVRMDGSCEVDVWPHIRTLTSDAISRTAFGSNYEEGRKIFELQNQQATLILNSFALLIPGWRFLPTKVNRKMKENAREAQSCVLEIINKRMQLIERGSQNSNDLLGLLLESNFKEIQENGNEFGMSMEDVIEECKLFYIAGQTTTSSLLVWTMLLLGKHLDWQERARDEILHVFANNEVPDFHNLNRLKVVTMIFHEVLRLYPPGVILSRAIHQETTLKNLILPGGVQLFLPAVLLHHDKRVWGDDADDFKPERFSEGVSKATKDQFSYFPFGGGPRICIGQSFALLEAKLVIAMILQRYAFVISPSYAHAPEVGLSLQPQYGAQLILRRI
ncbi:cytochrome P450 72A225-like [Andrographis paniculata]|uniref:cytochrome P450 72A225-like n=1 Tax=Andrographis paniculata TaxID=175694 RepID=UPI0021E98B33|nr:cytochrome P450 72A225-like [Andrographis paniculata]